MFPVMHQYKLRLTNLSQANRSLKLSKLSVRKDLDLTDAGFVQQLSAPEILSKIIAGQSVTLLKSLSSRDEASNLFDRRLNNIFHEVSTINEETGTYDLFLGYPFVEGKFLDGSIARCPVVLFPVQLERDFQGGPRWVLRANPDEDLSFNTTFFLAYEKFMQVRLKREFWESSPERHDDLQGFLNGLYKQMADNEVTVHFNSELFQFGLDRYADKNAALLDNLQVGMLRFLPHAVMGIFPQSDSALLQDYEVLEREADHFELPRFFEPRPKLPEAANLNQEESYFVSTIDQTQEEALLRVRAGESVVLHGPPGTGKSQVILNLISDALARGQRVLVCSQKRAALDVVFQRMNEVGLGRFAALVHDYRADRNKIFARIRQQIDDIEKFEEERRDVGLDSWMKDFERDGRRLDEFDDFFERLFQALTVRGQYGLSAHELYLMADVQGTQIDMTVIAPLFDYERWLDFSTVLSSILDYDEFFAAAYPWRERLPMHGRGYAGKGVMAQRLQALGSEIAQLHARWLGLQGPGTTLDQPEQIAQLLPAFDQLQGMVQQPGAKDDLANAVEDNLKPKFIHERLQALGSVFEKMAAFKVLDGFSLASLAELQGHFSAYETGKHSMGRFFSLRWLKAWWYVRQLMHKRGHKLDEAGLKSLKGELDVLTVLLKSRVELEGLAFFMDMPQGNSPTDLLAWHRQKLRNTDLVATWLDFKEWEAFKPQIQGGKFDEAHWATAKGDVARLREIQQVLSSTIVTWQSWLHPAQADRLLQGLIYPVPAKTYAAALEATFAKDYDDLSQLDALLEGLAGDQRTAMDHLEGQIGMLGDAPKEGLLHQVTNGMLLAWLALTEAAHPELLETSSRQMPERLQTYRQLMHDRPATVTGLIQRKLKDAIIENIEYNRLSNPVTYRDIGHQVRKQRQLWPVRKLVQSFWDQGLARLMPCWMASPESVAAIFPMVKDHFDLVIFDEASQCYVERALPVMLRGKQCVIAGDDQQLPPFDLYNVKVEGEEDPFAEAQMPLEVESILDLSRNLFPQCKLSWHYRSSEKELINFSNFAFYEGRLNMAPPAKHDELSIPPISFVKVAGIWDRNRNEVEAREVVVLVEQLVRRPDNPTIGVVTFNYHQKELIRELLELRLLELGMAGDKDGAAMLHRAMEREEGEERQGIFIKNIENVQGDERDVIIFSVGYARNPAGKLVANFGLLNQKGGGNRLNVAITRAKKRKMIVCSIDPEELQVEDAKHDGPRLFKRYLQYARALSQGEPALVQSILAQLRTIAPDVGASTNTGALQALGLATRLEADLKGQGWEVERGLGDYNFMLDLALRTPDGSYALGIECEGRNYFSGRSAKEREVYRTGLLEHRGWEIYRLWARNYFLNPDQELRRITERAKMQ
jgi:hypothetical protein